MTLINNMNDIDWYGISAGNEYNLNLIFFTYTV
jgi:hypothetical protein